MVVHVDMDAFYAAIEQRDDPALRGKPVIVGGTSGRGVVSTCSYEARVFGVRSAMPSFEARRRCPQGIFVTPRIGHYAAVSRQLMAIFDRYSPSVEPLSLDEAFLDMSGAERLFGPPEAIAASISAAIRDELALTASIGVATTKYVAKVASDFRKPNGVTVVAPGTEKRFLAPLPLERIWGVGPKAAESLRKLGLSTIGDVAATPLATLEGRFGNFGAHIWHLANGHDERHVMRDRQRKSIGSERTLERDITGADAVRRVLLPLTDEVARGLRAKGWRAHGVRLKLKYADFRLVTRDTHVDDGIRDTGSLRRELERLLQRAELDIPMRLVGVAAFDLVEEGAPTQGNLFDLDATQRQEKLETALDSVIEKFGKGVVVRGSTLEE